jgi:hypothetical protein
VAAPPLAAAFHESLTSAPLTLAVNPIGGLGAVQAPGNANVTVFEGALTPN